MLERLLSKRQVVANVDKGLGNRGPFHCWWGCKLVQSLWKTVWRFLRKLKIELSCNPAVLPHKSSSIYLKQRKKQTPVQKDICTPMFSTALFTIPEIWKQPVCPLIDEQIKVWYMWYTAWNITQPWKEWNLAICNNVDWPKGYYAKWNKSDGERQVLYGFTCVWDLKTKRMNKQDKDKSYRYREQRGDTNRNWKNGHSFRSYKNVKDPETILWTNLIQWFFKI